MKTKRTTIFAAVMAVLVVALAVTAVAVFSPGEGPDKTIEPGPTDGPSGDATDTPADDMPEGPVDLDAYILEEIVKAFPADYSDPERFTKHRIEDNGELVYKDGETVAFIVPEMPVKVRVSSDGGVTWRENVLGGSDKQPEGHPPARYYPGGYIGFNGESGYVVLTSSAAGGHEWIRIYLTNDAGETWYEAGLPDHNEVTSGAGFASDKVGFVSFRYAMDHGPDIWRTTDGGKTWSRLDLGLPEELHHFYTPLSPVFNGQEGVYPVLIQVHDPNTGEVLESDSVLYFYSHDGGLTWALEDQ